MSNVVKQGGAFSPIIFFVYTDGQMKRLQATAVIWDRCHMGHRYNGEITHVDELTLVFSQVAVVLSILISECEGFAADSVEYHILMNGNKRT